MTIADEIAVISSAARPIEPAGLELAAVGVLAWYLDLWLVPYVLMAVGVFVLVTSLLTSRGTLRVGPNGIETKAIRLEWADIASFNVERGWFHQYVAVRPVRRDRMVLPAPRTAWFGQQRRFDADVDRLAAACQAYGGPTVHRRVGNSRARVVVLLLALAILTLFERPWYWARFNEYAAPANACAIIAAARAEAGRTPEEGQAFAVDYKPGWTARGCDAPDGIRLSLLIAERRGLMSGAGVAASELTSMTNVTPKAMRDLMPDDTDGVVEDWSSGYGVIVRVANVLIKVGPTDSVESALTLARSVARHL